jgi:peroxiredoxin
MMFDVLEKGTIPNIGDQAPPSVTLTAADVTDLSIIDTSPDPSLEMHEMSVKDAVTSGKPSVILFAAPGYCTSRMCGPEYEIMKKLYNENKGKGVNFVHVEFYSDPSTPQKRPVAATSEWNLRTEPWFFVVDGKGKITARFEGPTGLNELQEALQKASS